MDVSNACVNANIDTDIYIQFPTDTPFLKVKNFDGHITYAHIWLKSLYGLKQSNRNWQLLLKAFLLDLQLEKWTEIECIMRLITHGKL